MNALPLLPVYKAAALTAHLPDQSSQTQQIRTLSSVQTATYVNALRASLATIVKWMLMPVSRCRVRTEVCVWMWWVVLDTRVSAPLGTLAWTVTPT